MRTAAVSDLNPCGCHPACWTCRRRLEAFPVAVQMKIWAAATDLYDGDRDKAWREALGHAEGRPQ
jgi:hypothetical protein